jgi:hypothetical protein
MIAFNGSSSLKRVATIGDRTIADDRVFEDSDYFLSQTYVDQFAGEVGSGSAATSNHDEENCTPIDTDHTTSTADIHSTDPQDVDNANREGANDGCPAIHWTAAAEKGTWAIFKESGLFASACRHGLILWLIDMIQSGEL